MLKSGKIPMLIVNAAQEGKGAQALAQLIAAAMASIETAEHDIDPMKDSDGMMEVAAEESLQSAFEACLEASDLAEVTAAEMQPPRRRARSLPPRLPSNIDVEFAEHDSVGVTPFESAGAGSVQKSSAQSGSSPSASNGSVVIRPSHVAFSKLAGILAAGLASAGTVEHGADAGADAGCVVCRKFLRDGACPRGQRCRMCHGPHDEEREYVLGSGRCRQRRAKQRGSIQRIASPDPFEQ